MIIEGGAQPREPGLEAPADGAGRDPVGAPDRDRRPAIDVAPHDRVAERLVERDQRPREVLERAGAVEHLVRALARDGHRRGGLAALPAAPRSPIHAAEVADHGGQPRAERAIPRRRVGQRHDRRLLQQVLLALAPRHLPRQRAQAIEVGD